MARPTEFDRQQALTAAMQLFWRQGYTATSLSQLLEAMGIGRSSFYAAFSDKRTLFTECLELFYQRTRRIMQSAWDTHQSPQAFREFFHDTLFKVPEYRARRGCMMVNTVLELDEVDTELSQQASRQLDDIEELFATCFESIQQGGDYPGQQSPQELAACLMVINQGLRVASRKGLSRDQLSHTVDASLSALGLAGNVTDLQPKEYPA
jgi:TetR/AcrR family transcriptional repressor of nem operon